MKQIIRITGKASKVFFELELLALLYPNKTLGELVREGRK